MPSSPSADSGYGVATAAAPSRATDPEGFASFLRSQDEVDALCEKYAVPKEFIACPAGDLRANSTPPPGSICVYARALEAGMRVPLHGFFHEALAHFGIAPAQLTPNGWRFMEGFLALCHSAGVPPSLAVFLHFFTLYVMDRKHKKGWYFFSSRSRRESSGLRFTGMPSGASKRIKGWKHDFFFLSSPEPWHCAVEWGEPSKRSFRKRPFTVEEMMSAVKLLSAHGGNAVDLRYLLPATCPPRRYRLRNSSPAVSAAMITTASPPPPPPSTRMTSCSKGTIDDMMKTKLAEKAVAQASASAKKRTWEEANTPEEVTPLSVRSPPPQHFPSGHDWEAARELLQGAVAPPLVRALAAKERSDEAVILQAANYVTELEEKLMSREREAAALRAQLDEAKNERAAAGAELEETKDELAEARAEAVKTKAELIAARAEVVKTKAELGEAKQAAEVEAVKTKAERAAARDVVVKTMAELAAAELSAEAEAELVKAKTEVTAAEVELVRAVAKLAAAETELETARAAPAQQLLASEEHVRRRAEQAPEGYERWRGRDAPAGHAA